MEYMLTAHIYILIELCVSLNSHRGSGEMTVNQLSDDGILTGYTSFLNSPVLVTGAVLAGTTECTIQRTIAFNASIQGSKNQGSFYDWYV